MRPRYMGRDMKFFPVTEGELDSFGAMNMEANVYLAVGTGLISGALGIIANHVFADKPTAAGNILCFVIVPLLTVLGCAAFWLCRKLLLKRDAIWQRIVDSSAEKEAQDPAD
jgi:hypothetical protein